MRRKLCGKCLRIKDISEFNKEKYSSTGYNGACHECYNAGRRKWYKIKMEGARKALEKNRKSQPPDGTSPVKLPPVPEKADKRTMNICQCKTRYAILAGYLVRPEKCSVCGQSVEDVGQLVAHHVDYNNPLDVVFLCRSCHTITHNATRGKEVL
jgi:hypothetical protein